MSKKRKLLLFIPLGVFAIGGPIALTSCKPDPATYFANNKEETNPQLPDFSGGSGNNNNKPGGNFSGGGDERPY